MRCARIFLDFRTGRRNVISLRACDDPTIQSRCEPWLVCLEEITLA